VNLSPSSVQSPHSHLRGPVRRVVRVIWLVLAVLTLGVYAASVVAHFRQMTPPVRFYEAYATALDTVQVVVFFLAAAAIFWRRSHDRMAVFVSTALLMFGAAIVPTLDDLLAFAPAWRWPTLIVRGLGIGLTLIVLYTFPDGQFVPRFTRPLAFVWVAWLLAWSFSPIREFDPTRLPLPVRVLAFLVSSDASVFQEALRYLHIFSLLVVLLGWFGSGVLAQIHRYRRVSGPVQRQQTKWVVFGLTAAVVGYFGFQLLRVAVPGFHETGLPSSLFHLIGKPISVLLLLLVPITFSVSILERRLWDIDPIIKSTLVYGIMTGGVTIVYLGGVFVFQRLFRALTGQQSDIAIVIATLVSASLVRPLSRRLQNALDRLFYRERVDFRRAITTFSREIRTIIDLPELLRVLVSRTTGLLHIAHGAVFLRAPDGTFHRAETPGLPADEEANLELSHSSIGSLVGGHTIGQPEGSAFSLLVPLIAPRTDGSELVGVLALGPRLSGQDYSYEDRTLLTGLADQAGTAIYVARLIQEKRDEARRREEVERRLEAYRNSPLGRAEAFAQELLFEPEGALVELHRLAQASGQDPNSASLIDNLPRVLDGMRAEPIARLAEGFNYLLTSRVEPEVLPVGLRTLIGELEDYPVEGLQYVCRWDPEGRFKEDQRPQAKGLRYAAEALAAYQLSQAALQASSVGQITQLLPSLEGGQEEMAAKVGQTASTTIYEPFRALTQALFRLRPVAEALYAFERMDTSQDKLSYLASAVERLRRVEHLSRTELGSADRPVVQRIAENWLTVITGAISELQTRAEIVCRLLTRHTWQEDVVPLVLTLRNEGRGVAVNVRVTLVPKPEYTMLVESAQIDQIAPGEEARVELRVRPHLPDGVDRFRARFVIAYADPRGSDQVENFADVVRLLAGEREFQFIPNPYVVGTPLEAGSSLFFGREDVIGFIQENLAALHRNNLVLIGQRRTGKTSLLKQLPVRLGDDYLPVYLDGQALGLDPGLPNFFLALSTEIAFALEDRGFVIDLPQYEDFVDSPATSFERGFLGRVRQTVGDRHLLIMFDEFEELESAVDRGNLDPSIFGFLRHLVQHSDNLSVIFCGTHRLEELASDYWSVLFNISLYRQIAFLEQSEALRLIQEPVAEYGMRYDDLALDKIWRVTAGHPYFLQLLCHSLVNRHNKTERNYITISDVNAALDEILASGEAHFVYLWTEATPEQRLILAVLSRMTPLTGRVTLVQVVDYLAERGVNLERRVIGDGLHYLTLRNILTETSDADPVVGETYGWRLGLLGLWVEKYRSMTRVVEEVVGAARLENE
jgi:hypothetical protein